MIKISFFYDEKKKLNGFESEGHALYAEAGNDIICAAVSALVFTTINSIEKYTDRDFEIEQEEKKGRIYFRIKGESERDSELLLRSFKLGVEEIQKNYGKKYIRIIK